MMQIRSGPVPQHVDVVAPNLKCLGVKRLCNITQEMDQELQRLLLLSGGSYAPVEPTCLEIGQLALRSAQKVAQR